MTKTKILTIEGKEGREIELPKVFSSNIREDIAQKCFEIEKKWQPYAPEYNAGKKHSASGKIKRRRKAWKSGYGHGISRVPRKIFWRRGTQFYWVAAEVASTRGGRRAHPPRIEHFQKKLKINKKEKILALNSGFAATASPDWIKRRYSTITNINLKLPLIIESEILKLKAKNFLASLKNILNDVYEKALKNKKQAGLLLVTGKDENYKTKMVEIRKINKVEMKDLWPLGRLAVYTEQAIKDFREKQSTNPRNKSASEVALG